MECTPNRESLLALIQPDTMLTKEFLKRIYAFEISYPGFSEQAKAALEAAGYSKASQYYDDWVNEYETARNAELREVAHWHRLECEKQWEKRQKEGEERRIMQATVELLKRKKRLLMQKSQILTGG